MDPLFDEAETILLKRYREGDESALKSLIERYQQKVFALVLYSSGCDPDKAYEMTVSSFVAAIRAIPTFYGKTPFLRAVLRLAIGQAKEVKSILSANQADLIQAAPVKKQMLEVIKRALFDLPFETRQILLLRDQVSLPYEDISSILEVSQGNVKTLLIKARTLLRERIEAIS